MNRLTLWRMDTVTDYNAHMIRRTVISHLAVIGWTLVLSLATAAAGAPDNVVRRDWYFRQSLRAIRDWETLLAQWEKRTPEKDRTPVFPLPADGQGVDWPVPVPASLWPKGRPRVQLRLAADEKGKSQVRVTRGPGAAEFAPPDKPLVACRHVGGGAKDHWYHHYHRRFDAMLQVVPRLAPFALELAWPDDWQRGTNSLSLRLRNAGDSPLRVALDLTFLNAAGGPIPCGRQELDMSAKATASARFDVHLADPGGGMLVLNIQAGKENFWLPLLTYVEDVEGVLRGVEQVLADDAMRDACSVPVRALDENDKDPPDGLPPRGGTTSDASTELRHLLRRRAAWSASSPSAGAEWRGLFEQASALRDRLLLGRIDFDALLFLKRRPFNSEQPFMDAHHLRNPPGGGVYRLSPVRPDGTVTPVLDSLGEGVYRDLHLHWDAGKLLLAFGNGSDNWDGKQSYHIYELKLQDADPSPREASRGLSPADQPDVRQITRGPKNDCEPLYLADGSVAFTSDRGEHFIMCGGDRHAANLYACSADGSNLRRLSSNMFNDFNPTLLSDGRILYSRWEYNERSVTSLHNLFAMRPDGTHVSPVYGNATIRPNVIMFPRQVPGTGKVMALLTAHHGQTHGPVGLVDADRGVDGEHPLTVLTPDVPVSGEKVIDSFAGWFSDPVPLNETTYLCSYTPTVQPWLADTWAIYVGDRHGNIALVLRDESISLAEPLPLVRRPRPHAIPPTAEGYAPPETSAGNADDDAHLLMLDVYEGLSGVARGTVKSLRIIEDVPRVGLHRGGVIVTSATNIYTVKRILGTVGVEADGSAYFVVPADRNVYFEALDADGREVQRMRSVVCLRPGERRTCVGCHEGQTTSPPNRPAAAWRRPPSRPAPPPWGRDRTISYLRDVQPLLDEHCVRCHAYDRPVAGVILTGDLTDRFCISYEELVRHLHLANAMRWDHGDDVYARPPYTYGSRSSPLCRLLDKGHHGVKLSGEQWQRLAGWIDANGVYYDRYDEGRWPGRRIFAGQAGQAMREVYARRCSSCHGREGGGERDTWWLSLNWRRSELSRCLQAPLARAAGGWQRCGSVFATADDGDYRAMLAAATELGKSLRANGRGDLLSLEGTGEWDREVPLPPLPPPKPAPPSLADRRGTWLSDLKWASGASGWSINKDKLPRLDRDAENQPLRLGGRRYVKGIGTHAPSEIVYPLNGAYARFAAVVGGAEERGTVVFRVYGDDKLLFDSGRLEGLGPTRSVDVSVKGVRRLRLVVTDAGDGIICDMANWAEAAVFKE